MSEEGSSVFETGSVAGGGFTCLLNPVCAAKHLDYKQSVHGLDFELSVVSWANSSNLSGQIR